MLEVVVDAASGPITSRDTLRRRLLLVLFALGTNRGIRSIVDSSTGQDGVAVETEAALRRVRRLYVNRENLRECPRICVGMSELESHVYEHA